MPHQCHSLFFILFCFCQVIFESTFLFLQPIEFDRVTGVSEWATCRQIASIAPFCSCFRRWCMRWPWEITRWLFSRASSSARYFHLPILDPTGTLVIAIGMQQLSNLFLLQAWQLHPSVLPHISPSHFNAVLHHSYRHLQNVPWRFHWLPQFSWQILHCHAESSNLFDYRWKSVWPLALSPLYLPLLTIMEYCMGKSE